VLVIPRLARPAALHPAGKKKLWTVRKKTWRGCSALVTHAALLSHPSTSQQCEGLAVYVTLGRQRGTEKCMIEMESHSV